MKQIAEIIHFIQTLKVSCDSVAPRFFFFVFFVPFLPTISAIFVENK